MVTKLIVLIAALGLVGCALPPPAARAPSTNTQAPTQQPAATASPAPGTVKEAKGGMTIKGGADAIITFRRQGGLAGGEEMWTVNASGAVQSGKGAQGTMAADDLKKLMAEIEADGFFNLQDNYKNAKCNDCYEYQITVNNNGKLKSVTATDDGHLPPELTNVLGKLATAFAAAH